MGKVLPFKSLFMNDELKQVLLDESIQVKATTNDENFDSELYFAAKILPDPMELKMRKNCNEKIFKRFHMKDIKGADNASIKAATPIANSTSLSQIISESWTGSRIYMLLPKGSSSMMFHQSGEKSGFLASGPSIE